MSALRRAAAAALRLTGLYHPLRDLRRDRALRATGREKVRLWREAGRPAPPPDIVKYACIRRYAEQFGTPVLVETGTFRGDAIFTLRDAFQEIHSIELSNELYRRAVLDLGHLPNIRLHLGDSTTELPRIAGALEQPALYWLDGHFCAGPSARGDKDTPVFEELTFLLGRPAGRSVILIDDARLFTGKDGYPTIEQLRAMAAAARPDATFAVEEDIIRIAPV
jgi:hypothetical protein